MRFLLAVLLAFPLHAATRTWSGAVNQLWSNAGNWDGGAPIAGDDLVFTIYEGGHTINDFPAGTVFNSLLVSAGPWTFSGNTITLTHGISAQTTTFALPISLAASQQWTAVCCHIATFTGGIDLNGHTLTLRTNVLVGGGIDVQGPIHGEGTILLSAHRVSLRTATRAHVVVTDGTFEVNEATFVRSFEMNPSATFLAGNAPLIVSERVRLAGTLIPRSGTTIILNDSSTPVEGRFDVVPQGVSITYTGGDGNDVVIQTPLVTTMTTLTSSRNPASAGTPVTFTAAVTASSPATGTVTFRDGGTELATVPVNASGQASFTASSLSTGTHPIIATYDGSPTHAASASSTVMQVITGHGRRRAVRHVG